MNDPSRPLQPTSTPSPEGRKILDPRVIDLRRENQIRRWVELLSAVVLAVATTATAWSGYQSALWSGEQARHQTAAAAANVKIAQYANLSAQKTNRHISLFGQWAAAVSTDNTRLADLLFARFPEPLKTASTAWLATEPLSNPNAPATPFEMPEYALPEAAEVARWEATAVNEASAAEQASAIGDGYLLFTIIFASVLFFGGIAGKFRWLAIDITTLALGIVALVIGLVVLLTSPIT